MRQTFRASRLAALSFCAGLTGCDGTQAPYSQLESVRYLKPNPSDRSGRVTYRYFGPVSWRRYDSVVVEPVAIYRGPDHSFGGMPERDKVVLANYMQAKFTEKLGNRFAIVPSDRPNSLRIRLTLTGALGNTPTLGTLSRFDLAGAIYNGVQSLRDREGLMTGSVTYAVEIFEATDARLIGAYIAKQYPRPYDIKASVGPLAAAEAGIDRGAIDLVAEMMPGHRSSGAPTETRQVRQ